MGVSEVQDVLHEEDCASESLSKSTSLLDDSHPQMIKQYLIVKEIVLPYPDSLHEQYAQHDGCMQRQRKAMSN